MGVKIDINNIPQPPGKASVSKAWIRRYRPGTKALQEIHKFQKPTELPILKMAFLRVVQEILQWESPRSQIQVGAILVLHEAAKAYLICLLEDTNCAWYMQNALPYSLKICNWHRESGGETSKSLWTIFILLLC